MCVPREKVGSQFAMTRSKKKQDEFDQWRMSKGLSPDKLEEFIERIKKTFSDHMKRSYPSHTGRFRWPTPQHMEELAREVINKDIDLDDLMAVTLQRGKSCPSPNHIMSTLKTLKEDKSAAIDKMVENFEINLRIMYNLCLVREINIKEALLNEANTLPRTFRYTMGYLLNLEDVMEKFSDCRIWFDKPLYQKALVGFKKMLGRG